MAEIATRRSLRHVPWTATDAIWTFVTFWLAAPVALALLIKFYAFFGPTPAGGLMQLWQTNQLAFNFAFSLAVDTVAVLTTWYYLRKRGGNRADLGWRRFNVWQAAGLIAGGMLVLVVTVAGVTWLVDHFLPLYNTQQPQNNEFTGANLATIWSLVALVILPPVFEESVFRGFMLPAFARRFGFWGGAALTSLLFGLAHWQVNVGVYTFILGMILAWLYRRFDSIVPGVLLHMLNNLLTYWALLGR